MACEPKIKNTLDEVAFSMLFVRRVRRNACLVLIE